MCIEKVKEFLHESNFENNVLDSTDELNEEDYENSLKTNTLVENSNIEQESDDGNFFVFFLNENFISLITANKDEMLPEIIHGEPICDRKSTFQGHLAPIKTRKQVNI